MDWAVPALNLAGGLLLAGGLTGCIGKQVLRLVVPVAAVAVVAGPYLVFSAFSKTAADGRLPDGLHARRRRARVIGFQQQRSDVLHAQAWQSAFWVDGAGDTP